MVNFRFRQPREQRVSASYLVRLTEGPSALKYRASVAACGLAGGRDLPASVIPFLLRGVNPLGIDSVMCPREERITTWQRSARDLPLDQLDRMARTVPPSTLPEIAPKILGGQTRGRLVVDIKA